MSGHNLLSKEWCNLIFEGRNKDYGAYQIRKNMGRRYFVALSYVFITVFILVGVSIGLRVWVYSSMEKALEDWEKEIPKMKMCEAELGHEMKAIPGRRRRPQLAQVEKGTTQRPEIVEVTKNDIRFGVEKEMAEELGDVGENEILESFEELDSLYEEKFADLPVEGPMLHPVEVVEQMPQFPGGTVALMRWLDENVVYPQKCVRMKIGGEVQVNFLVDVDGTLHDAKIVFSLHPDLDRSVLNAIRRMPRWQPGTVNGKLSVVSVTLPVHFQPR